MKLKNELWPFLSCMSIYSFAVHGDLERVLGEHKISLHVSVCHFL